METESISEVLYFGARQPFYDEKVITDMSACSLNYFLSKFLKKYAIFLEYAILPARQ